MKSFFGVTSLLFFKSEQEYGFSRMYLQIWIEPTFQFFNSCFYFILCPIFYFVGETSYVADGLVWRETSSKCWILNEYVYSGLVLPLINGYVYFITITVYWTNVSIEFLSQRNFLSNKLRREKKSLFATSYFLDVCRLFLNWVWSLLRK